MLWVLAIWLGLNLAIPGFIVWQRSPHFRHRVYRATLGAFASSEPMHGSSTNRKAIERF